VRLRIESQNGTPVLGGVGSLVETDGPRDVRGLASAHQKEHDDHDDKANEATQFVPLNSAGKEAPTSFAFVSAIVI
jgi:hypothetical protein